MVQLPRISLLISQVEDAPAALNPLNATDKPQSQAGRTLVARQASVALAIPSRTLVV